ncbi:transcriptional regulator [Nocardia cyriacigeorgica]|uniref:helix-turn-helix domain-containing protein n=1 Tax=Nocardia cyriacigeorgica TaxID=135487 RepID=UPI001892F073|nr:helix-turn-helix domain-containing protein [Nocardia cyriacigeorgica]MBF6322996.1 transcriptional regulator [Nocardia cyriacigeorgica]
MARFRTLTQQRTDLEKEWERVATASGAAAQTPNTLLRSEVAQSWRRSLGTVDPGCTGAPGLDDIGERWARSPLRAPVTELSGALNDVAVDAGYLAAVTDATGAILWSGGDRAVRRRAEQVNFAPGGCWDEAHMGTNAVSMSLLTDAPSTVFCAEHLVAALHGWVCYCAPIHAPDGRQIGALDLSSSWDRSHPLVMSSVRALVTAVETMLRSAQPPPPAGLRLECLGESRLTRDGFTIALRPRQLEILTLLALEPDGFTPEQLHAALYGDRPVTAATLKAEVSHLRRATGGQIGHRRYLLAGPISCDAVDLLAAIAAGDTTSAVWLYRGALLPGSDTPGIAQWRAHLEVGVRNAVLASDRADHAVTFGERVPGDIEVHEHALRLLPSGDVRRAVVTARLHTALRA